MAGDYIPTPDPQFYDWVNQLATYCAANQAALGVIVGLTNDLTAANTAWRAAYTAHQAAQTTAKAKTQAKNDRRATAEHFARVLAGIIQANPAVSDEQRLAAGLPVGDSTPTAPGDAIATARPMGKVDTSQRLQHTIAFFDSATPTSRAKPRGAMGCEIHVKIGDPAPADSSECAFLALDTASPYVATYEGAQANKTAHYMLRWVTTAGDKGPWSETVSATIGG